MDLNDLVLKGSEEQFDSKLVRKDGAGMSEVCKGEKFAW